MAEPITAEKKGFKFSDGKTKGTIVYNDGSKVEVVDPVSFDGAINDAFLRRIARARVADLESQRDFDLADGPIDLTPDPPPPPEDQREVHKRELAQAWRRYRGSLRVVDAGLRTSDSKDVMDVLTAFTESFELVTTESGFEVALDMAPLL